VRAIVQRVSAADVTVAGVVTGRIGPGLCVLVGVTHSDTTASADRMAERLWHLRILSDADGRINCSAASLGAEILVVSQFSLYADTSRGRRPSFAAAAGAEQAEPLVQRLVDALRGLGAVVATGRFGADMAVALVNDGPLTVTVDT
jgi:D-tyrosyl-tRNA(Tyr) deacylase